jgi:hypothetical protein
MGASALGIGACGRPAPIEAVKALPPPAVTSGTADVATPATTGGTAHSPPETTSASTHGWPRCVNSAEGFSIKYPPTWYTTQIRPEEVCVQFHPSRFVIPPASEYPLTALNAKRVTTLPSRTDTAYERILLWRKTTVAGRQAVRFETSSTGEGLDRAGTRQYGYVVGLGGGLISVHTTAEPGETRYAAWKAVVDNAVGTLAAPGPTPSHRGCAPIEARFGFYAAGRVGTDELTTPASDCSTIKVSHIADPMNPADRCQTFRLGFWPLVDGSLTYTEPVTACGEHRTVLAANVPDNARYLVVYDVDYIDPEIQKVTFKVWH